MSKSIVRAAALTLAAAALCAGCDGSGVFGGPKEYYVRPTIAVMKFENRAPFPLGWSLGSGMRDMLVDRLVATQRFQVIERPEIGAVMSELELQHSGATREQNRAERGRLKNAQYLIKGTITDFGHVITAGGFLNLANWDVGGSSTRAVMGITLYVVDVESGEIICSEHLEKAVGANDMKVQAVYKDVAFGGSVFYRTPLGRATSEVISRAVRRVAGTIANRPWQAKIASVEPDSSVILNGGRQQGVCPGQEYEVVDTGATIVDPDTGDILGRQAGKALGRLVVSEVHERHSLAKVVRGKAQDLRIGQRCCKADAALAPGTR